MEWEIDPSTVMSFGGKAAKAIDWYNAARVARKNLDKLAKEQNWSEDKKAEQDAAFSQYQQALKKGDQAAANEAWNKMDPAVRDAVIEARKNQELLSDVESTISNEQILNAPTTEVYNQLQSNVDPSNYISANSSAQINQSSGITTDVDVRNTFNMNASNQAPANPVAAPQQAAPQQLALNTQSQSQSFSMM